MLYVDDGSKDKTWSLIRQAHDQNGDQEGIFTADDVADAAEHDGAEGANQEAGSKRQQGENVAGGRRIGAEELRADDRGERAVKVKVVPFENGAGG